MYHPRTTRTIYYVILIILIFFSFFTFSEQFYPFLNPEMAINVLMTPGFSIPGDLYFWGQDHSGSLIPLISQIICSMYHFPPILAVSIVHFIFLITGYFALSTLFKDRSLKLALAFIWFFPCWHFLDHLLLLQGVQLSLLAISIYFLNRLSFAHSLKLQLVWISGACLSFISSIWITDVAVFSLLYFIIVSSLKIRKSNPNAYFSSLLKNKHLLIEFSVTLVWFIVGTLFILYAKRHSIRDESYNQDFINNYRDLATTLGIIIKSLIKVFTFGSENILESLYAWAILIGIPWILIITKKKNDTSQSFTQQRWLTFFFLNGLVSLSIVVLSHWVFMNGVNRRFFTLVYFSFWLAFLLYLQANGSRSRSLRLTILFIIILTGSFSSFYKFYIPNRIPPSTTALIEFKNLGNIGLIAEGRNAYLLACTDPGHIKATPHEKDRIINSYLIDDVFRQPRIFLVRDSWLNSFPDTIQQFGHTLIKMGNVLCIAGYHLCQYFPLKLYQEYTWSGMKYQGIIENDEEAQNGQSICPGPGFDRTRHFIYGPFITLAPGRIVVKFRLKTNENLSTSKLAFLDISADFGKTILASRMLQPSDFGRPNAFQEFEIPLELKRQFDGIEFRVLYLGSTTLSFDRVIVQGI
jgi:hypothetical protein